MAMFANLAEYVQTQDKKDKVGSLIENIEDVKYIDNDDENLKIFLGGNEKKDQYVLSTENFNALPENFISPTMGVAQNPQSEQYPYCPIFINERDGQSISTVYITDAICDISCYVGLLDLLEHATEKNMIDIYIDSPGGMVCTGSSIASSIHKCKGKVTTIARGLCASAGSLIWSAGHVCKVGPLALFMYHMSSHMDHDNSEKVKQRAESMISYVSKCLLVECVSKGHITQEEHRSLVEDGVEIWISASEMAKRINSTIDSTALSKTAVDQNKDKLITRNCTDDTMNGIKLTNEGGK